MASLHLLDKKRVLRELVAQLELELASASAAQKQTVSGATHEESRPENDKDTRALESSYLARGQAKRVVELTEARLKLQHLELLAFGAGARVALSALLNIEEAGESAVYFLAPAGGGLRLRVDQAEVRVVTPESPLGRALIGKYAGDDVEVRTPQAVRELTLLDLA